jgi:3-oxoacyl-[acyl-carrier-protein] synthase II
MDAYIRTATAVSPQPAFHDGLSAGNEIREYEGAWLRCIEPEYKEYINPILIRRMSRIVKMGVAAAMKCMNDAGIKVPDAIITGTGMGCMEDTGSFLRNMVKNKEQLLTPTAFIQSTHNTISSQIALMIKCNNYNFTYVHRGFSFESALLDAFMMMAEGEVSNILLGGIDEVTQDYWDVLYRLGMWKKKPPNNLHLLGDGQPGTLAGEGSVFFMLQKEAKGAIARFTGVDMIYQPATLADVSGRLTLMLDMAGIGVNDIDAVIMGYNGWPEYDRHYHALADSLFNKTPVLAFKHLCGEYMTASSFAALMACGMIKNQHTPEKALIRGTEPAQLNNILIYNHFLGAEHTLILLSAC